MPKLGLGHVYNPPSDLVLGTRLTARVPQADQRRQRTEAVEILSRLRTRPGVVLADEVGMGKTFVALAVACSVAIRSPRGPVVVMVPANLIDKWEQDLSTFCELYLDNRRPVRREGATGPALKDPTSLRFGVARDSIALMKLLDDRPRERCHLIFLAQGAMGRRQTDKWTRLALIAEALRRHARGKARRLNQVKRQIHRFLGELLWALGEERAHDWGEDLWHKLIRTSPERWKDIYNDAVRREDRRLDDDQVPKSVVRALSRRRVNLKPLSEALERMPVRARGGDARTTERLDHVRRALRDAEDVLWQDLLAQARWRSPLLVMDEAHHLKNPRTLLARQLQSPDAERDLRTGDGAMANAFDRMLFLTATPFQLGHHELVRVLERFADVRWSVGELGKRETLQGELATLEDRLTDSQRTAMALQRSWGRLRPDDVDDDVEAWWARLRRSPTASLNSHQRAVVDAYEAAKRRRDVAEGALRPWVVRHNKGTHWVGSTIERRNRVDGAAMSGDDSEGGLTIPPRQLLPFFLAARSAVTPGKDLLGDALSSSYEAFRFTRQTRRAEKDEQEEGRSAVESLSHSRWYLAEFDQALERCSGVSHPKVGVTVRKAVDLWEQGEKVLVFAFYRHTCRALRIHISEEIERRLMLAVQRQLHDRGRHLNHDEVDRLLDRVQRRYFDDVRSPGRRAHDGALGAIVHAHRRALGRAKVSPDQRETITGVMRRFLRVRTTLVRCFPLAEFETIAPPDAVQRTLEHVDSSGVSWRQKFDGFFEFLTEGCSAVDRALSLEASHRTQTRSIRVDADEADNADGDTGTVTLANVQVATGETNRDTRARLMRAFNTPFFPDVLVCSQVMGEGVDLQRFCRQVIHHDLAWNPSTIEQRTGRIDRIGCKAEGRHPIMVYLPYLAGTADERQYRVMTDREQWFRVVMGQEAVARLITHGAIGAAPLPSAVSEELNFKLGL